MQVPVVIHADFSQVVHPRVVKRYQDKLRRSTVNALNSALRRKAKPMLVASAEKYMGAPITEKDVSAEFRATKTRLRVIFALHYDRRQMQLKRLPSARQVAKGVQFRTGGARRLRRRAFITKDGRVFRRVKRGGSRRIASQAVRIRMYGRDLDKTYEVTWEAFWMTMRRALARIEKTHGSGGKFTAGQKAAFARLKTFPGA